MKVMEVVVFILLLYLSFSSEGKINKQFKIVLENPLENFPLKNMEIDLEANIVYVSGKNIIYRLSMEKYMKMMKRQTGPEANCLTPNYEEYCGDDYNTVMVVTPDSLITCGTLKGGLCLRRNKNSLNETYSTSSYIRLVSDEKASAVGIFLNISDGSSSKQFENIVLFAKEYTPLPLTAVGLDKTAIFSALPDLPALSIGSSKFGKIFDMILRTPVTVKLDYRVVFENEKFVFLLVNQNSQSKLVKICKSIDTSNEKQMKVYEDIPISCNSEGTNLTHVKHGYFITVNGTRYLVGLFSSSNPTLSAVCVFEENEIYEAFLESRIHRYGCPSKNDLPAKDNIFDADEEKSTIECVPYRDVNETNTPLEGLYDAFYKGDYCNSVTNMVPQFGIVVGLLPLEGKAVFFTSSHQVTVVGSLTINNLTTLYIGTDNGSVIQVFYDTEKNKTNELREIKVDSSEIRAIRNINDETYVMSQNKIVKLLPTKKCGLYSELCQQCMDVRDAHCGWCVTKGICSTYSECTRLGDTHWLPSVKNECLSIDLSIDLSRYAYKIEGKLLVHFTQFFKVYSRLTLSLYFNLISICWETFFLSTMRFGAKRNEGTNRMARQKN